MCLWVSCKKKYGIFFFCILKVTEERSWIRILKSEVRIRGSGSVPKFHGSPTLVDLKTCSGTGWGSRWRWAGARVTFWRPLRAIPGRTSGLSSPHPSSSMRLGNWWRMPLFLFIFLFHRLVLSRVHLSLTYNNLLGGCMVVWTWSGLEACFLWICIDVIVVRVKVSEEIVPLPNCCAGGTRSYC